MDHVLGHARVDLAGQLDETRRHAVPPRQPGEIEWVDGNAMPAQAGTGIKRLESEGLGPGGVDHLPDVDADPHEEHLQFVDQGDIDRAVGVFQDLGGLGHFATGDRHDLGHGLAIEQLGQPAAGRVDPAHDLGNALGGEVRIARILPLGTEGQEEIAARLQAALLQDRQHDFPRRAGIGRAFQDHELPRPQDRGDLLGRLLDVRQVRVAAFVQRGGNADQQGIGLAQPPHVGRGQESGVGDILAIHSEGICLM